MLNEQLRDRLSGEFCEEMILFDNPSFDNSIIGVSVGQLGDRAVYSYDKMVSEYMEDNSCSEEDAVEFIDYNTIRSLDYLSDINKPIIILEI